MIKTIIAKLKEIYIGWAMINIGIAEKHYLIRRQTN